MKKRRRFFKDSTTFDVAYLLDNSPDDRRHSSRSKGIKREDIEKELYSE